MPSSRLTKYLQTLDRLPAITDVKTVSEIIETSGLPIIKPVIEFHCKYAGFVQPYGRVQFIWGLFHSNPHDYSFFQPNRPHCDTMDENFRIFTCCNCHASDHWFLDETGALYWCYYPPLATSFEKKIERDAVAWELNSTNEALFKVEFDRPITEILPELLPGFSDGLIEEASDHIESLYWHKDVYAAVKGDSMKCYIIGGETSSLLDGIPYHINTQTYTQQVCNPSFIESLKSEIQLSWEALSSIWRS